MFENIKNTSHYEWDVIVIGSGLAGIYTALNIESSKRILVVTKRERMNSNSSLAQGGIAAVLSKDDSIELRLKDTMRAGAYENDELMLRYLIESGPDELHRLQEWQVPFDKSKGELCLAREGAHSVRRIARCGDHTGKSLMETLFKRLDKQPNIEVYDHTTVTDLKLLNDKIDGIICVRKNKLLTLRAKYVVMATGGLGQLFQHTTNDETITGDGFNLAKQAGLQLKHMDKIQFHPTAFFEEGVYGKRFLISEALRGEGAILKDDEGYAFMDSLHPLGSLAPRDIVSAAIISKMNEKSLSHVYLDATHLPELVFSKRFPTIYKHCKSFGLDTSRDFLPVVPCAHYLMGGIPIDQNGRTKLKGLYACGEVAYTNVHGNNRLASNSLLECLVFGRAVAEAINEINVNEERVWIIDK